MNFFNKSKLFLRCWQYSNAAAALQTHDLAFLVRSKYLCCNIENSHMSTSTRLTNNVEFTIKNLVQVVKDSPSVDDLDLDEILSKINLDMDSQEHRALLLHCSGRILSDKSIEFRQKLCKNIWNELSTGNLTVADYDSYVQTCTENEFKVNYQQFISTMTCEPSKETLCLLLENVCTKGDIESAIGILTLIKDRHHVVDNRLFNVLLLGHTIKSGLEGGREVLQTMKTAHISQTSDTHWHLLRGLAANKSKGEFLEALENYLFEFDHHHFFQLLLTLGIYDNIAWLYELKTKLNIESIPRTLYGDLEHVCVTLLYRKKYEAAVDIYCNLVEAGTKGYGRVLLEEMMSVQSNVKDILKVANRLTESERNALALEDVTEIALRNGSVDAAWVLLEALQTVRPHYFWPILLRASREKGEPGVLNAMKKMLSMNVTLDAETLEYYCLPFCDMSNPKQLLLRLERLGLTVRQLLSPILVLLLRNGHIEAAADLCEEYNLVVHGKRLPRALALAWKRSENIKCTIRILRKICESEGAPPDSPGILLLHMFKQCRTDEDCQSFLKFGEVMNKEKFHISTATAENFTIMLNRLKDQSLKRAIQDIVDDLLDISVQHDMNTITHPRNMSLQDLECHLTELTGKSMETRGALRLLIQEHGRLGNHRRVQELRQLFLDSGYEESAGMQARLLQTYIQCEHVQEAVETYNEIKSKHRSFKVDDFKILDLAALMVKEDMFDDACRLISKHGEDGTVRGGTQIEKNCLRLLGAAKNPDEAHKLFTVLKNGGYCTSRNTVLGPIVRSYLKCNDLEGAVAFYLDCAKSYKCTPLQFELLGAVIEQKNEALLQNVLKSTSGVHGDLNTRLNFMWALAEKEMISQLKKLLMESKHIPEAELRKRCVRWVRENKLAPLEALSKAACRLPSGILDVNIVYLAVMQLYSSKNDCESALAFIKNLRDDEIMVPKEVTVELDKLLKRCKYTVLKTRDVL